MHRNGLACGEPNVIDMAMHTQVEPSFGDGRIAVWGIFSRAPSETCLNPCLNNIASYGCQKLLSVFEISRWVRAGTTPDGTDGTYWHLNLTSKKYLNESVPLILDVGGRGGGKHRTILNCVNDLGFDAGIKLTNTHIVS